MGIELSLSPQQIDRVFFDAASPGVLTEGIENFLSFLKEQNIRTGVISNISNCGENLKKRIDDMLPMHEFEFIIASSEYMYRKPNRRIFELALEKADLQPEDVWYVGDNYECDVVGSKVVGIFPVWYVNSRDKCSHNKEDILTISHWDELKRFIMKNHGSKNEPLRYY